MFWKAARAALGLSLLFLIVYFGSNFLASRRHDVPSLFFPWEHAIPFMPWLVIPYMSIDLFFVAAPFLCRDDRELRTLSRRIAAAILIAGTIFILWPLRFAFDRPPLDGWQGAIFNNFRALDHPFNQLPSLHITLSILLAQVYLRRSRGFLWALLTVWFTLIIFSAVLTYQRIQPSQEPQR